MLLLSLHLNRYSHQLTGVWVFLYCCAEIIFILQINYSMIPVQMKFLRLLSRSVYQNITYHCYNSRAWDEQEGRTIRLQGDNEMELTSFLKTKPIVLKNGCKVKVLWHLQRCNNVFFFRVIIWKARSVKAQVESPLQKISFFFFFYRICVIERWLRETARVGKT